jgi:hypothetical protein
MGARYNIYGLGRTRPMSPQEAHWRDMGVKLGLQMRKPPSDPLHKLTIKERWNSEHRFRQREMAKMAVLTPHPP